ncbi:MAG: zf-TFIIB domain-containing protein [Deltaproteobacteria bacterium]|nr:zf-TFIIB domain-containing protein [Deltaproteobacteria bacterium]MBN2670025.1 zf-TFIIB domain-containing protein [Deltaproteobacteria bacterium]
MCAYNRSDKEQEYFAKQEAEKLKAAADKHARETAEAEKKRLQELHYMKCPKCGMDMQEIEFRRVKIDKCFSCGGVYFDDGELEQIIAEEGEDSFFGRITSIFK